MRAAVAIVVQFVVSLLIMGALMPALLATVPAARNSRTGFTLAIAGIVAVFGLLRMVWPRPKGQ
jgi:hypothetical protein